MLDDAMQTPLSKLLCSCWLLITPSITCAAIQVTAVPSDVGATITIEGQPFAEYRKRSGYQPVIWPIIGPTGKQMTRSWPVGPRLEGEVTDHPHHRSLWFSHGDVNGLDFWGEFAPPTTPLDPDHPLIAHRSFVKIGQEGPTAVVITKDDWMHKDTKVCEDVRTIHFGAEEEVRWIDFQIELRATDDDVTFGDTKEGSFGIRVPGTMKVDAKLGGHIVNSNGQTDEHAWGEPAAWVSYSGPIDGETLGITVFNHPSSFRFPTCWHVRTYGLFAANPFAERQFPKSSSTQGAVTLHPGESITLRYVVFFHTGTMDTARAARLEKRMAD